MKAKNNQRESRQSASMVEDKATEKLKKRLQDAGLIVIATDKTEKPKAQKKGGKK